MRLRGASFPTQAGGTEALQVRSSGRSSPSAEFSPRCMGDADQLPGGFKSWFVLSGYLVLSAFGVCSLFYSKLIYPFIGIVFCSQRISTVSVGSSHRALERATKARLRIVLSKILKTLRRFQFAPGALRIASNLVGNFSSTNIGNN